MSSRSEVTADEVKARAAAAGLVFDDEEMDSVVRTLNRASAALDRLNQYPIEAMAPARPRTAR